MSVIHNDLLLAGDDAYNLTNSLRFRSSASAYLSRTPASNGSTTTWTYSTWIKRGALAASTIFSARPSGLQFFQALLEAGSLYFYQFYDSGYTFNKVTTQVFRDCSAWYHFVFVLDTNNATASDRVKIYVNGSRITSFQTSTDPSLGSQSYWNTTTPNEIGRYPSPSEYFDGYMAEVNFIDGQALTPSSFGENNAQTGVWQPKRYSGTYGTNGFYLPFTDNSALTSGSNAGLGKDFSGNGNYWNTNNISITSGSTYDSMTDVPTLTSATASNFAVMNPLGNSVGNAPATLTEGNLKATNSATSYLGALGSIGLPTSGKFYWEVQLTQTSGGSNLSTFGIAPSTVPLTGNQANFANSVQWYVGNNNNIQLPSTGTVTAVSGTSTTSDLFQICYDGSTGKVYLGRNNTFYTSAGAGTGNPSSGTGETATLTVGDLYPWFFAYQEGATFNFGQRPFAYTPPTGFKALNTYNLPTPTIGATASTLANKNFDVSLWSGNSSTQSITNSGSMQPDFVWMKARSTSYDNTLQDSVRGTTKYLFSNTTAAEGTTSNLITSFNSNGFTMGDSGNINQTGQTYVGWQWKASGSTVSNTVGDITSTVSANTSAGFSVVTWTGNGVGGSWVGHGLNVAPSIIIVKNRDVARNWVVCGNTVAAAGGTGLNYLLLNSTAALGSLTSLNGGGIWNVWSTKFTVDGGTGTDPLANVNTNGKNYVAYCFSEVAGYSKFGTYTGNGSSDGTFIALPFKPKFVMTKCSSTTGNWMITDSARNRYNLAGEILMPNNSDTEYSQDGIDLLSNGFKLRASTSNRNSNGATYIYMAFAEVPQKFALGV